MGVNGEQIENEKLKMENLEIVNQAQNNNANPENQLPQILPQQPDMETILNLVKLVYQYATENGGKSSELEKLAEQMESLLEEK